MMYASSPDRSDSAGAPVELDIRHLSEGQLATLGVSEIAYVKQVPVQDGIAFAIHAADGTPMAVADDAEVAMEAIREHGMVPARVH